MLARRFGPLHLVAITVTLVLGASMLRLPPAQADEVPDVIEYPVTSYSIPLTLDPATSSLTIPATPLELPPVASQCTPVPGLGNLCLGSSTGTNEPVLDIIGVEELTPLVKAGPEASSALDWIVAEGEEVLRATYGLPADSRIGRYARPELRAYLLNRVLDIVDRKVAGKTLSADEQRALDFVDGELLAEQRATAKAAYEEFQSFQNLTCSYHPPAKPASSFPDAPLPSAVTKWCGVAHHPSHEAFVFAPPQPSVDEFTTWGAYRTADERGLGDFGDAELARNTAGLAVAATTMGGLAAAGLGALGAAVLAGSVGSVATAFATLMGSAAVTGPALSSTVAAGSTVSAGVAGVGAAAGVVGIVIVAAVILAVSIWQFVEHQSVGVELRRRVDDAASRSHALDLSPGATGHRDSDSVALLLTKIAHWTTVGPDGTAVADPEKSWPSTASDPSFEVRVGAGTPTVQDTIQMPLVGGTGTVRVADGWPMVSKGGGPEQAALSFGYVGADGANHTAVLVNRAGYGFIDSRPGPGGGLVSELTDEIRFVSGGQAVRVRLAPSTISQLAGPRPSAVGPLLAGRPVLLRPNPVMANGSTYPYEEAQSDFTYAWTVTRRDPTTGAAHQVATSSSFGTSFTPTQTGDYHAVVTMTSLADPSVKRYGQVGFVVSAPPITLTTLALEDDGFDRLEVDLQLTEPVNGDSATVIVTWPRELGQETAPTTTIVQDCVMVGPVECMTPRTGTGNLLVHDLTNNTDLREPVVVTVTNAHGMSVRHELPIDDPSRPRLEAPPAGANAGQNGAVSVGTSTIDVTMVGGTGNAHYVAATLVPGVGGGQDFGLVLPGSNNTVENVPVPGTANVYASAYRDGESGAWQLEVWGNPGLREAGTYELPLLISQTSTTRTLAVVVVHVVPSTGDRYRGGFELEPNYATVAAPPELTPAILGGRADWEPYDGDLCLTLQHVDFGAPERERCGPRSWLFEGDGTARAFPYPQLFPDGMPAGIYRASVRLAASGERVDTARHQVSFVLSERSDYPAPAVEVAAPTIGGPARVGEQLTVTPGAVLPRGASAAYQWLRDGTPIAGATGLVYRIDAGDVGHRLSVRQSATYPEWTAGLATSAPTAPVEPGHLTATPDPAVSGTARVGHRLDALPGAWDPGVSLTYQWYAAGQPIPGAQGSSLTLGPAQVGAPVTVGVTGAKAGYMTITRTSAATAPIAAGALTRTPRPKIQGQVRVGRTLVAVPGRWDPGVKLSYRWFVGKKAVRGATGKQLRLAQAHRGKRVTVRVTGSLAGYLPVARTSAPTAPVRRPVP